MRSGFFLKKVLFPLNILSALAFLLAILSPFISPANLTLVAFFGLAFIYLLILNLAWFFFWLLFKKKFATLSLIVLTLGVINLGDHIRLLSCFNNPNTNSSFIMMSYNVKNFDLYNWLHNEKSKNEMLEIIGQGNPDVLCLQEFFSDESEKISAMSYLSKLFPYVDFQKTLTLRQNEQWGILTLSKYPIVHKERITFPNSKHNLAIITDIALGKDTIRLFNAHLQSIHFGQEEYKSIEQLQQERKPDLPIGKIFEKLNLAFKKRASQVQLLKNQIEQSPYPVMVCVDMNDTPGSYTYHQVSKGLNDSFKEVGCGLGTTYSGPFPSFRIDYILADKRIRVDEHEVIRNPVSDHYPIVCHFSFEE